MLRFVSVFTIASLVAACGTFQLSKTDTPPPGATNQQVELDILTCKDEARDQSQTTADQTRGFLLGATLSVIGVAIDYEQQKADQRRIFKECLESKGYTNVVMATD